VLLAPFLVALIVLLIVRQRLRCSARRRRVDTALQLTTAWCSCGSACTCSE